MKLHWVGEHFPEAKKRKYMGGAIGQKNENTSAGTPGMGPGVLLSGRGGAPGRPGGTSYRWASAIDLIYRIKMVLTRASGTVMASSLKQNKFLKCVCVGVGVGVGVGVCRCRCRCLCVCAHENT